MFLDELGRKGQGIAFRSSHPHGVLGARKALLVQGRVRFEELRVGGTGDWWKPIELDTCVGTGLGRHSLPLCLSERMLLFLIPHLSPNDHSGHNASQKERN